MKTLTYALAATLCISLTLPGLAGNPSGPFGKYFTMPNLPADEYKAKTVILKLKEEYRTKCTKSGVNIPELMQYVNAIGATSIEKMFFGKQKPEREKNPQGIKYADLSLIYYFDYQANDPLEKVINRIYAMGIVKYAEPWYIPKLTYTPNDPNCTNQQNGFLTVIDAWCAWNTQKGDTNVVIGITDTGIDTNHPDLDDNIKYNYADPINSIDDDNDGYIDNFRGWDVAMNDNNPQWQSNQHGVHVSGCASAETDNNTGVAGPGFNCKILPVKVADNTGALVAAYQGITYAADHGADIINCSWGGGGSGSFGQDVVTYATINKDALVVASAGNGATEELLYPSSYDWVIRVAATQNNDIKAPFSSYGYDVDVSSPGVNIYSTTNNSYGYNSGTSMASPIAAGCCGLIKAEYPSYNAIQIGQHLKATTDNHYGVNPTYIGKLGTGRINMCQAVGIVTDPSIIMTDRTITDNNNDIFVIGDTLRIYGDYTNYLAASGNITATLSTTSPFVGILDNNSSLGVINTLQTVDNNGDPFDVRIFNTCPLNEVVTFTIHLDDGNYSTDIIFTVTVNVDYINIAINDVATTITSKSPIGWNNPPTLDEGLGFTYLNSSSWMYEGGLMVGVSGRVSDYLRGDPQGNTDTDFQSFSNVKKMPNVFSEFDVEGWFNDDPAGGQKLDIDVHHKAFAWTVTGHTKYVIVEYTITNTSGSSLNNLYAGIFSDWDVMDYSLNRIDEDATRKLGYTWSNESGSPYLGIQVLTSDPWNHYAIDNDGSNGSANIYDGYPTSEKYTTLSTSRATAGQRDVTDVVSTGPFTITSGDSITVAFALLAADDLAELKDVADSAWEMYNNPCGLQATSTIIDATCSGSDGSATANPTGGTTPYTYQWDGNAGNQTTQTATGLSANGYWVTVTDNGGCSKSIFATVGSNNVNVNVNTSFNQENCGTSDGDATASPTSGNSPYSYVWSNGQTNANATGLTAGTYTVTVTDDNGCTGTQTVTVTGTPALQGNATVNNAGCNQSDGDATINVTIGSFPYTYQWDSNAGNQTTQQATGLAAGSYDCTVTDNNGCSGVITANVSNSGAPTINPNSVVDLLCNGDANGSVDVNVTGGTTPYTYAWSNSATTQDISGLSGGVFTLTVTDNNNCITIYSVTITEPTVIAATEVITDVFCNGDMDGAIDLFVSGGTSPYNYAWSNSETTEDINSLSGGTYTVTITDNNNCTTVQSYTVNEAPAIIVTGVVVDNQTLGSIDITATSGSSPYSYSWSGPNSFTSTSEDISGLTDQGIYIVTTTDNNGCTSVDTFVVAGIVVVQQLTAEDIKFSVYPNPNNGLFSVQITNAVKDSYKLEIRNILGQVVYHEQLNVNGKMLKQIDLSDLSSSIYFLNISSADVERTQKIIINK